METYTIDELLYFIEYWLNHYNKLKLFLGYTFITVEDKAKLIENISLTKYMVFKYIKLLMNEMD